MNDFTLKTYHLLLESLLKAGYSFQTFEEFLEKPSGRVVILRHDVDALPHNSLATAKMEKELGIKGTYYFRIVKQSNRPDIIREIADLGHEIGYHYEDLALTKGNMQEAIAQFEKNLEYFRGFYPVKTICMHGSPLSRYDNRDLWKNFDYKDYGIWGEPYFDIDFSEVFYLTDTGRRWDGQKVSVRDKVNSSFDLTFKSTHNILAGIHKLPPKIMITTHPQRWTDKSLPWIKELVLQNAKNLVKKIIAKSM